MSRVKDELFCNLKEDNGTGVKMEDIHSALAENLPKLKSDVSKHKNITVFLGNTKSGKSTVINYLMGHQLDITKDGEDVLITKKSTLPGPQIGAGFLSETKIPDFWSPSVPSIGILCDMPGFDDNRGISQDMLGVFYTKEVINNATSVRFVLVSDARDLMHTNVRLFTGFLKKIHLILPSIDSCKTSLAIIFTHVRDTDSSLIPSQLEKILVSQIQLGQEEQQIIKHFVDNKQYIGIFKIPLTKTIKCGQVDSLLTALQKASYLTVQSSGPIKFCQKIPLSTDSLLALFTVYVDLIEYDLNQDLDDVYKDSAHFIVQPPSNINDLSQINSWIKSQKQNVTYRTKFNKIEKADDLWSKIGILAPQSVILSKKYFIDFFDGYDTGLKKLTPKFLALCDKVIDITSHKVKVFEAKVQLEGAKIRAWYECKKAICKTEVIHHEIEDVIKDILQLPEGSLKTSAKEALGTGSKLLAGSAVITGTTSAVATPVVGIIVGAFSLVGTIGASIYVFIDNWTHDDKKLLEESLKAIQKQIKTSQNGLESHIKEGALLYLQNQGILETTLINKKAEDMSSHSKNTLVVENAKGFVRLEKEIAHKDLGAAKKTIFDLEKTRWSADLLCKMFEEQNDKFTKAISAMHAVSEQNSNNIPVEIAGDMNAELI